jgi:hypothetical protein
LDKLAQNSKNDPLMALKNFLSKYEQSGKILPKTFSIIGNYLVFNETEHQSNVNLQK